MSLLQLPYTVTTDTVLVASNIITLPYQGWIMVGPGFTGNTITMDNGFANDLYVALGAPALLYAFTLVLSFVGARDYSATLSVIDPDIDISNSTTLAFRNGRICTDKMLVLMFVLTQVSPPQWTVYG